MKPADVAAALEASAEALPDGALVVSLAAGVTLAEPGARPRPRPAHRACHAEHRGARRPRGARRHPRPAPTPRSPEHLATAEQILGAVGTVVQLPEPHLDAVTALSGSGPRLRVPRRRGARRGGRPRRAGPRASHRGLVRQTLLGAATLLAGSKIPKSAAGRR